MQPVVVSRLIIFTFSSTALVVPDETKLKLLASELLVNQDLSHKELCQEFTDYLAKNHPPVDFQRQELKQY